MMPGGPGIWAGARACLLLGLLTLAGLPTAEASQPALEWWGPTEIGQGFHLRIPVTVTNPHSVGLANAPALLQVDLGKVLREAGWVSSPSGDRDLLQAFRLATQSVRVVAMTNLNPQAPGTIDGRLRLVDPDFPPADLRRFEVPSLVLPGYLDARQEEAYDAQTNPVITVVWEVAGLLQPGETRAFMVYFDTPNNVDHPAPDYTGSVGGAHLQGLYWSGAGQDLLGLGRATAAGTSTLTLLGIHPDTTVRLYGSTPGGQWRMLTPPQGFQPNPVVLQAQQTVDVYAGAGPSALVRILADKPVFAWGVDTGFVPALDGGMAGRSFLFAKTLQGDDVIHFINAGDEPTRVMVQPLGGGGSPFFFEMSNDQNPLPYTVGSRGGAWTNPAGGCVRVNPMQPSPPLPGIGLYRATVTEGGPVMLQHGPNRGLFQVPTRQGAPAGQELWSATGWTDRRLFQPPNAPAYCRIADNVGGWFASSLEGAGAAWVSSMESEFQVDPPGNPNLKSPPPRPVAEAPRVAGRFSAAVLDRPLQFHSGGNDMVAFVGVHPVPGANSQIPQVHGPLGGADAGRRFVGLGPTVVFAPYPNTEVTARLEASASGVVTQTVRMTANQTHLFGDLSANDWVYGVHLESNRPIVAYPLGATPGTLAALPTYLRAEPGPAEFRGYLVSLASPTGLDPVTGSTTLGAPITYALQVANLGRQAGGGSLVDTIALSVPAAPPGWTATLDRFEVTLGSGQVETVHLTVQPDASVPSGSLGIFPVTAVSRGNPNMQDVLGTVTYVQRSFDVGLWFEVVGQPKALTLSSDAGKAVDFPLVVKNRGSVADVVRVDATTPAPGWRLLLLHEGEPATDLALEPGHTARLVLRVTPPEGTSDGLLTTQVTAQSQSSLAVLDRVVATTRLRAPSLLRLDVAPRGLHLLPGQAADFNLTLQNRGQGAAEVDLTAALDRLRGWVGSLPYVEGPDGAAINLTRISVAPGESFPFKVRVRAPPDAPSDQAVGLHLMARNRETTESLEEFLHAFVRPLHRVGVSLLERPVRPALDANRTTLQVRLTNQGNLDELLTWKVEDLPRGWSLQAPAEVLVARNATQQFSVTLRVPPGQAVGHYNLTAAWASRDGNRTMLRLPVVIGTVSSAQSVDGAGGVPAQPGRPVRIEVPVRNEGNVPLTLTVEGLAGEEWSLDAGGGAPLRLQPGMNRSVVVAWRVPEGAPDGVSSHGARLVFTPEVGAPFARETRATIDVGRADLVPMAFRAYAGPAGTLVEGRIANVGDRPAQEFHVRLLAGQETVEEVAFEELQAGANATVRLLLPHGRGDAPAVAIDPGNAVVERDEANNAASIEPQHSRVGAPATGMAGLLLAVVAVLAVTRRRWG